MSHGGELRPRLTPLLLAKGYASIPQVTGQGEAPAMPKQRDGDALTGGTVGLGRVSLSRRMTPRKRGKHGSVVDATALRPRT